jgi:molybdopterin-containing oxidoreductase family membrane subunit
MVLVLDLGRPDRLIVAMTTYNFRSIFAWNIFLYSGFVVLGLIYLWFLLEKRLYRHSRKIGIVVLVWRIALTTGTGSIFGFLVGRDALDTALLAPLFIALSFVIGTAVLSLILLVLGYFRNQADAERPLLQQLGLLLRYCLLGLAYFSIVHHLTNLYVAEHHTTERWFLLGGFSRWFWLGHVGLGVLLPLILLIGTQRLTRARLCWSALLAVVGSWALVYTIVIGSQSLPQRIFPDKVVIESSFGDAAVVHYQASIWEWGLGFGGVALGLLILAGLLRIFPLTPASSGSG